MMVSTYWIVTAAIGALPMPNNQSKPFYGWAFKFLNALAANLSRAAAGKIPGTTDVMPLAGGQEALADAAVVAKAVEVTKNP